MVCTPIATTVATVAVDGVKWWFLGMSQIIYLLATAFALGAIAGLSPVKNPRNALGIGFARICVVAFINVLGWSAYGFLVNYSASELTFAIVLGGLLYAGLGLLLFSFPQACVGYLLSSKVKQALQ